MMDSSVPSLSQSGCAGIKKGKGQCDVTVQWVGPQVRLRFSWEMFFDVLLCVCGFNCFIITMATLSIVVMAACSVYIAA